MKAAKIALFGEANKEVGAGHVMRLLSIADDLNQFGHRSTFVGSLLKDTWYEAEFKRRPYIEFSAPETICRHSVVLIDCYNLSAINQIIDFPWRRKIQLIDSFSQSLENKVDIRIDFSMNALSISNPQAGDYSGLEYTPIRRINREKLIGASTNYDILVASGGNSNRDFLSKIHEFLHGSNLKVAYIGDLDFSLCNSSECHIYSSGSDYDLFLSNSKILVAPCGTSVWEAISIGVSVVTFPIYLNQFSFFKSLRDRQLVFGDRNLSNVNRASFFRILEDAFDSHKRSNFNPSEYLGASRISRIIRDLVEKLN